MEQEKKRSEQSITGSKKGSKKLSIIKKIKKVTKEINTTLTIIVDIRSSPLRSTTKSEAYYKPVVQNTNKRTNKIISCLNNIIKNKVISIIKSNKNHGIKSEI